MNVTTELRRRLTEHLSAFDVRRRTEAKLRRAAVAVTIVDEAGGADLPGMPKHEVASRRAALVLTRRARDLRDHPGQWALPGGSLDEGEGAEDTALRELHEEVGFDRDRSSVIGHLDDFVTRSGFVITPVVSWGGAAAVLEPNPEEVSSVHRIPVEEFLRTDAPLLEEIPESDHPVLRMPVGDSWIAAPTAAILYQFREVALLGRDTRVSHFEQPLFAWR
ncbi:MAG: CoA pyrophosphatase [Gammaproteobacteria bacterium]